MYRLNTVSVPPTSFIHSLSTAKEVPEDKHLLVLLQLDEFQVIPKDMLQQIITFIGKAGVKSFDRRVCLITVLTGTSSASRAEELIGPSRMHPRPMLLDALSPEVAKGQ